MSDYLEDEKLKQIRFKATSPTFSEAARADGLYKGKIHPFCLPPEFAVQNLYPPIRAEALAFFATHGITWHDGQNGNPSNHLCSSQVCCLNFLFPFAHQPLALAHLLCPVFPEISHMLPVEDELYVSFEWIGAKNYLAEKVPLHSQRTRGAHCTSADAIVMFERRDKRRQIVLIEWKYTEAYTETNLKVASSGTDRSAIYRPLYDHPACPLDKQRLPDFDALFYEPFYQFMRQQFLAHEMEQYHELDADIVRVLHICPAANTAFRKITSPALQGLGDSATTVWSNLLQTEGRFHSVSSESLFGSFTIEAAPEMDLWLDYVRARYLPHTAPPSP
jgi:hypothetical protein